MGEKRRRKCSSRCWNSTGKICECECGGRNHGKGMLGKIRIEAEKHFLYGTLFRVKLIAPFFKKEFFANGRVQIYNKKIWIYTNEGVTPIFLDWIEGVEINEKTGEFAYHEPEDLSNEDYFPF